MSDWAPPPDPDPSEEDWDDEDAGDRYYAELYAESAEDYRRHVDTGE